MEVEKLALQLIFGYPNKLCSLLEFLYKPQHTVQQSKLSETQVPDVKFICDDLYTGSPAQKHRTLSTV